MKKACDINPVQAGYFTTEEVDCYKVVTNAVRIDKYRLADLKSVMWGSDPVELAYMINFILSCDVTSRDTEIFIAEYVRLAKKFNKDIIKEALEG